MLRNRRSTFPADRSQPDCQVATLPAVHMIPPSLRDSPFTVLDAAASGLTPKVLRGTRFRRLLTGVYVCSDVAMDLPTWIRAARLVLPGDATLSHLSALQAYGVQVGPTRPLCFVTTESHQVRRTGLYVSRVRTLPPRHAGVASAESSWQSSCRVLDVVDAVTAADRLLHLGHTTVPKLGAHLEASHAGGVRAARQALRLVRERAESPPETYVRLMLILAELPEPRCNVNVGSLHAFIGRADLAYTAYRVLVEYDGRQHADNAAQWNHDLNRHDDLTDATWSCVRLTSARLRQPREAVLRVHRRLVAGGYTGPAPCFGAEWVRLFEQTTFAARSRVNDHRAAWL